MADLWFRSSPGTLAPGGDALASPAVSLRTCPCLTRILGRLSGLQSSPCLDKVRQLPHSPWSSPGKLWNFRAEKAKPSTMVTLPQQKETKQVQPETATNLAHFLTPESSEIISLRDQLFVFVNDIWPKVNALVLGSHTEYRLAPRHNASTVCPWQAHPHTFWGHGRRFLWIRNE